jgi:hypothetical protein
LEKIVAHFSMMTGSVQSTMMIEGLGCDVQRVGGGRMLATAGESGGGFGLGEGLLLQISPPFVTFRGQQGCIQKLLYSHGPFTTCHRELSQIWT